MSEFANRLLEWTHSLEAKKDQLLLLQDKIFLHGFGAPLSTEHKLRSMPDFLQYKNELGEIDDAILSILKAKMKLTRGTLSLSNEWLRDGQDYSKAFLRSAYDELIKDGCTRQQAVFVLPELFNYVEIDRQACTFSSKLRADIPIEISSIKMPLVTAKGGISGFLGEKIERAIKNIQSELIQIRELPKADIIFEKAMQIGHSISR
jgi:hypothetical protein